MPATGRPDVEAARNASETAASAELQSVSTRRPLRRTSGCRSRPGFVRTSRPSHPLTHSFPRFGSDCSRDVTRTSPPSCVWTVSWQPHEQNEQVVVAESRSHVGTVVS